MWSVASGSALMTSGPHTERAKALLVWTRGMLQRCSQDSLWHTDCWKAWAWEAQDDLEAAGREGLQSGSSQLSTFVIETPGDLVWDLPWVQQASYLEGGPLLWILPLYLHVNQKSDDDDSAKVYRCTHFLARLDEVQEELLYYSQRRRQRRRWR